MGECLAVISPQSFLELAAVLMSGIHFLSLWGSLVAAQYNFCLESDRLDFLSTLWVAVLAWDRLSIMNEVNCLIQYDNGYTSVRRKLVIQLELVL